MLEIELKPDSQTGIVITYNSTSHPCLFSFKTWISFVT